MKLKNKKILIWIGRDILSFSCQGRGAILIKQIYFKHNQLDSKKNEEQLTME